MHKSLLNDTRLLVILFITFRLMMLMVYQPLLIDPTPPEVALEVDEAAEAPFEPFASPTGVERGVGAQGDRLYHYMLSRLTEGGDYPFIDWWSEFPPVWYLTTTTVYQTQSDYSNWSVWMGIILLAFDVGNLLLIRKIGIHLHGESTGMALAWIYTVMIAPMVMLFWNFETLVTFFFLLGLYWLLIGKQNRSALAIALGVLTKFTPALIFGALIRFRPQRMTLRYIAIVLSVFVGVYALLYAVNAAEDGNPDMVTVSLTAQFNKASYQTVWALIDGNYTTGNFGSVESHFDPDAADELYGEPAVIPSFVRLALAGAIGLFIFLRTRRLDDRGLVAFVTVTLLIFFLQSQGWSPQWMVQIIPFVLLSFPNKNGVLVLVLLTFLTFTEYPLLFIRTGDTGGIVEGTMRLPFVVLILSRTFLLVSLCIGLYQKLRQEPVIIETGG